MKHLVITIVGKDKTGLVEAVSTAVMNHKGNWLASNLSHLGGYFAGIVQVEVPLEQLSSLQQVIAKMDSVTIEEEDFKDTEHGEQLNFVITGNDRPGIVHELSSIIRHKGANIIQFTSKQQSAPNWGVPLFNAVATVELPSSIDKDEVIEALESLASDLMVDIESHEH
jgi:glycine cleavage system regulatory protein